MKTSFLFVVCLVMLFSCSKKNKTTTSATKEYSLTYLDEIELFQYKDTTFSFPVLLQNQPGVTAPVNIHWVDLPDWITSASATAIAMPGIYSDFIIRFRPYFTGTYPIRFNVVGADFDTQSRICNVVVKEMPDCATYVIGDYEEISDSTSGKVNLNFNTVVKKDSIEGTNIKFRIGLGDKDKKYLIAYLDCSEKSLSIYKQRISGIDYQGEGTFTADTIRFRLLAANPYFPAYPPFWHDKLDILLVRK